ncbi:phosphotransferase family protein [Pseudomonas lopnurensis]|uniref:phosphotransferase family protein n=1 Tax=Pseudomonas lopnurensis TaxID=1477517 RepID=UPI0028A8BC9E|nr:phosphotransferase family protein [Pseudomonas lopnurensis]
MQNSSALETFVQDFILRRCGASGVDIERMERMGGGAIQENYALDLEIHGGAHAGRHNWVLRTDSPSRLAMSLGRAEEFSVLSCAFQAGVRAPEPLWLHRDQGEIGKNFYLMKRIGGTASGRELVRAERTPEQRASLLAQLGASLAALHSVTPGDVDLPFLKVPEGNAALARIAEYRTLLDTLERPQPTLEWALRQLELHVPANCPVCLVHGDLRTGNYMVEGHQLSGVLDWEFAAWSAAEEDIGWLCARDWRFGTDDLEAGGIGPVEALLAGYEAAGGRTVDRRRLHYWRAMASLRWALIALLQAQRHLSSEEPSLELALTGRMLPEIELNLLLETEAMLEERRHA